MTLRELQEQQQLLKDQMKRIEDQMKNFESWNVEDIDILEESGKLGEHRLSFSERTQIIKLREKGKSYNEITKILKRKPDTIKTVLARDAYTGMVKRQDAEEVKLLVDPSILKKVPTDPAHIRAVNLYYTKKSDGSYYTYKDIFRILLRENYKVGYSHNQMKAMIGQYYNVGGRSSLDKSPFINNMVYAGIPSPDAMFWRISNNNRKQS